MVQRRRITRDELIYHRAARPDIRWTSVLGIWAKDLWSTMRYRACPGREWECHPLQAALRHGLQDVARACGRRDFTTLSEVSDHQPPHWASVFEAKQDVGWLEVPVHDELAVQVAHAASELTREIP